MGAGVSKSLKAKVQRKPVAVAGPLPAIAYTEQDAKYQGAPIPSNEKERHAYLCALNQLDTPPDPRFDNITQLACLAFKVPIALVSLVDTNRQWFKSVQGIPVDHTDRKSSFCAWTLLPQCPEVLVVTDATKDARFSGNPLVTGPPDIRFYAGCPLVASNNLRLGSLCIIDRVPRDFDAAQCMMLTNFAHMAVRELEKEYMLQQQKAMSAALEQENTQLLKAMDAISEGIMLCDVTAPEWPVEFINDAFEQLTGFTKADLGNGFWGFFKLAVTEASLIQSTQTQYKNAIAQRQPFELTVFFNDKNKQRRYIKLVMRCANLDTLGEYAPLVGIPAILKEGAQGGTGEGGAGEKGTGTYYFATLTANQMGDAQIVSGSSAIGSDSHVSSSGQLQTAPPSSGRNAFVLLDQHASDPFTDIKLGQLLGRGSFGRVYRGRWNAAPVAVKILEWVDCPGGSGGGDDSKAGGARETMEALLSSQLSHPNVVQTYKHASREVGRDIDRHPMMETWIVMEFCNKGGLSDAIDKGCFRGRGPQGVFECDFAPYLTTAREIASAMCYLHTCRVIHGDLTANNILLASSNKDSRGFSVKVADFGLSRLLEGQEAVRTRTLGTITHMPPEAIQEGTFTMAADVYAYGVILWEMFMNQRPWKGLTHSQIITAVSRGQQLGLAQCCPASLKKIIMKCMSHRAAERPTFAQILKDLDELSDDLVGMTGDMN